MADEPRLSDADKGRAQVLDLASRLESYCEPPRIAGDAAAVMRAMVTEIDRLRAELAEARAALTACASQFQFYAGLHAAAGKPEKAATNQSFADLARSALAAGGKP